MSPNALPNWSELRDAAVDTFKVLARARLRSGSAVNSDEWYDLAVETAERVTPRRDVAILAVLGSFPALLARPLVDEARSLVEGAFALIRDALRDELMGRLHSLRQEVTGGRGRPQAVDARAKLKELAASHSSWEIYAPSLEEALELQLSTELDAQSLEELAVDARRLGAYVARFVREILPEELDEVVALIASSPDLAARGPVAAQSFEGCAVRTLEAALVEHLSAAVRRMRDRNRDVAA